MPKLDNQVLYICDLAGTAVASTAFERLARGLNRGIGIGFRSRNGAHVDTGEGGATVIIVCVVDGVQIRVICGESSGLSLQTRHVYASGRAISAVRPHLQYTVQPNHGCSIEQCVVEYQH